MAFRDSEPRDILVGSEEVENLGRSPRYTPEAATSTPGRDEALFEEPIPPRRRPRVTIEDTTAESEPVPVSASDNLLNGVNQMIRTFTSQVTRMNMRRERPSRTFSGQIYENPLSFVHYMDAFFRDNDIGEDHVRSDMFRGQLREAAKKWAQPLEGVPMSYCAFKNSFLRQYDSNAVRNEATSILYGEKQKMGESVDVFLNKKRSLFARINPGLSEIIMTEVLKDQLIPPIRSRLRNTEFLDMTELISQAGRVEVDVREGAEYWDRAAQARPRTSNTEQATSRKTGPQQYQPRPNRPPSPCRFCGQWHYHSECPHNTYRNLNSARVPEERGRPVVQQTGTRSSNTPRPYNLNQANQRPPARINHLEVITEHPHENENATEARERTN